jgi:hypothetical protein
VTVGWLAGIAVGIALLAAGVSKLANPHWTNDAAALGAPASVAAVIPWVELGLGALLIVGLSYPWVALGALALILAFTALVIVNLARGLRPPCACFGGWSAKPIGAATLVRNAVLLAFALLAALAS